MRIKSKFGELGFSVIELLVVVAVILIIAAIALPRMLQARMKAKEAVAISSMKAVQNAQTLYSSTFPETGYASKLSYLGSNGSCETISPENACLIDSTLAAGIKGDYQYDMKGDANVPDQSYTLTATPQGGANTSQCMLSMNESGTIVGSPMNAQPVSRLSMSQVGSGGCSGL
jgi:type IV pilus assembly protein PilA